MIETQALQTISTLALIQELCERSDRALIAVDTVNDRNKPYDEYPNEEYLYLRRDWTASDDATNSLEALDDLYKRLGGFECKAPCPKL